MRRARLLLSVGLILFLLLAGCNQSPVSSTSPNYSGANSDAQVSLSMTDEPPSGVTVLFFQISLTAAYLTPAMGSTTTSLLNNNTPIQVDVTQLQAISAFLSTANVPAGTYNNLTLSFANPQLVIFNAADQALASTCPLNTVCQLTPSVDNSSTLTFSSAPFPVAVDQSTPLGFLLDFHLNQVIQSDLSVNLGVANGVTVGELPSAPPSGFPPFGFLVGTVESVSTSSSSSPQFTLQTRFGRTFTIDVNSSTSYQNFPTSVCGTGSFSCLATGQVVQVQVANVETSGTLLAADVSFVQVPGQQVVEANIIGLSTSNGATVMKLLLHWSPDSGSLPFGGVATATVSPTATFSVGSGNFTIPSGLSFTNTSDLVVGQQVEVGVVAGSLANSTGSGPWSPPSVSFTTDTVELEPSQITGGVTATNASAASFTLTTLPNFFAFWSNQSGWMPMTFTVDTTSQTVYLGLSSDSFAGVTSNSMVSVRGWLFSTPSSATASTLVAETVLGRPQGFF
ncbi:MAG TPA: DUF4382 domain-containing protein [Terriglobales bacterium]|nr:DUF4382 domain-containing protein [Terriglobales bacterium]